MAQEEGGCLSPLFARGALGEAGGLLGVPVDPCQHRALR